MGTAALAERTAFPNSNPRGSSFFALVGRDLYFGGKQHMGSRKGRRKGSRERFFVVGSFWLFDCSALAQELETAFATESLWLPW